MEGRDQRSKTALVKWKKEVMSVYLSYLDWSHGLWRVWWVKGCYKTDIHFVPTVLWWVYEGFYCVSQIPIVLQFPFEGWELWRPWDVREIRYEIPIPLSPLSLVIFLFLEHFFLGCSCWRRVFWIWYWGHMPFCKDKKMMTVWKNKGYWFRLLSSNGRKEIRLIILSEPVRKQNENTELEILALRLSCL